MEEEKKENVNIIYELTKEAHILYEKYLEMGLEMEIINGIFFSIPMGAMIRANEFYKKNTLEQK